VIQSFNNGSELFSGNAWKCSDRKSRLRIFKWVNAGSAFRIVPLVSTETIPPPSGGAFSPYVHALYKKPFQKSATELLSRPPSDVRRSFGGSVICIAVFGHNEAMIISSAADFYNFGASLPIIQLKWQNKF
jgi:hypothetical protein